MSKLLIHFVLRGVVGVGEKDSPLRSSNSSLEVLTLLKLCCLIKNGLQLLVLGLSR